MKRLIERLFFSATWVDAGHGYEGTESELKLDGWTRSRRVIVTRREIKDNLVLTDDKQLNLAFIDTAKTAFARSDTLPLQNKYFIRTIGPNGRRRSPR
ncbi:MAG: hypothetical protein KBA28_08465 [Syntrophaceae bacterium]|nr:hypothetical protein [Syntrophaceae bacterium]